jgi:hypothetical protein
VKQKFATLLIAFVLVAPYLLLFAPVQAEVQKPSVPEFTVQYFDKSSDVPPTYGINYAKDRTLIFTIKNQPFTPFTDTSSNRTIDLFYNIRYKMSVGQVWTALFGGQATVWAGGIDDYVKNGYLSQNYSGQYTVFIFNLPMGAPSDGQMDFQVEALEGYTTVSGDSHMFMAIVDYTFYGEESGWSEPQTVIIGNPLNTLTPSPTESPTTPVPFADFGFNWQSVAIVGLVVAVAVLAVGLLVVWRRLASFKKPNTANL